MIMAEEIHAMPLHEKLRLLETLWENIAQRGDDSEMPSWQKELLGKRERLISVGVADSFVGPSALNKGRDCG
jgi:hypothetical protein